MGITSEIIKDPEHRIIRLEESFEGIITLDEIVKSCVDANSLITANPKTAIDIIARLTQEAAQSISIGKVVKLRSNRDVKSFIEHRLDTSVGQTYMVSSDQYFLSIITGLLTKYTKVVPPIQILQTEAQFQSAYSNRLNRIKPAQQD